MRRLPLDASDQAIPDLVREWVGLQAAEDYEGAYHLVASREHWSAELMRTVIQNYGSTEPHPNGPIGPTTPLDGTHFL